MGRLGRVLGLMHGAHSSFDSLAGVGRHRYDPKARYAAYDRARATGSPRFGVAGMRSDPQSESFTRLWLEQPSRMRAEETDQGLHGRPGRTMVVDGQRWWTNDDRYGARYGSGDPEEMAPFTATGFETLLDPLWFLGSMCGLTVGDSTAVAGRPATRLLARYGGDDRDEAGGQRHQGLEVPGGGQLQAGGAFHHLDVVPAAGAARHRGSDPPAWSTVAPSNEIRAVPLRHPPLPVDWRHPDIVVSPDVDEIWEKVYAPEGRRAGLRGIARSTWYGMPGLPPGSEPPLHSSTEIAADDLQADRRTRQVAGEMLDPGPLLSVLDLEFGGSVEIDGRAGIRAVGTCCAQLSFPRRPGTAHVGASVLIDWGVERVEVVIDPETGILLMVRTSAGDDLVREVELHDVAVG